MKNGIVIESNYEYHSYRDAISKSRLANMSKTPAYFKWYEETPQEPTDDLILGSAFHKLVLESEGFFDEFAVLPNDIDRRTKVGKEQYAQFLEDNKGKAIINHSDFCTIVDMKNAVLSNPYVSKLFDGNIENSMYFTDELTGVECKVRPDCFKVIGDTVIITDLKSCKSAMPEDFMRDIVKYSYDLQAYMYRLGVSKVLGVPIKNIRFVFVCAEKKAPYLNAVYEVTQDVFDRGEMLFRKYIGMYKECKDTNNWYGYNGFTNAPMEIGLPEWLKNDNNKQGE